MKKFKRIREKITLHPMMAFFFLTVFVVVLSGVLDFFDASLTYNKLNLKTGDYDTTLITAESLLNLSGLKYIFSHTVSNFVSFTPLSMLLIVLIGIGIMDRSGFLDTMFFVLTKRLRKTVVTYVFVLICLISSLVGDLSFIVLIPLAALLFKYGKRNPLVGIITAFASISLGFGINIIINSIDSTLINYTETAARLITNNYTIHSFALVGVMIVATFIAAGLITYVTERFIAPKLGKYEVEEEIVEDKEKLTKREMRGLLFAGIGVSLYLLLFIYNIIPYAPLGGNFLDYSQSRYIDKLFGYDSFFNSGFVFVVTFMFFLAGLLYGLGTKSIKNHRDICNFLSHSLDGIGKVITLLLFASMFISLLKYTNIGDLITVWLVKILGDSSFSGIPLVLLLLLISMVSTIFLPSMPSRWAIISGTAVPMLMTAGFSPEFTQMIFSIGSSIVYPLTPALAYFVIYISYMEKYDKSGINLIKGVKYIIPYSVIILAMWLVIILLWYLIGIPLGISASVLL